MKLDELREMVKEVLQEQFEFPKPKPRKPMLPSLPRRTQGPPAIRKVDRDKLERQGKSWVDLEARTEEEAREERKEYIIKNDLIDFPGKIILYSDLNGSYFLSLDYGRLGT